MSKWLTIAALLLVGCAAASTDATDASPDVVTPPDAARAMPVLPPPRVEAPPPTVDAGKGKDAGPKFAAAGNYAYPVGPAGGKLTGSYPNPGVTLASSDLPFGTAGQFEVTNAGATAMALVSMSGDCTMAASGAITCTKLNGASIIPVSAGGTGLATINAHGVMIGEGTSNVAPTTAGAAGQVFIGQGASSDPSFQTLSGKVTVTSGGVTAVSLASSDLPNISTTGDVACSGTAGALTSCNVSAISGTSPIPISSNAMQWAAGAVPLLSQAAQTSDAATNNFMISPQAPFASATGTNRNSAGVRVNIASPVAGGADGQFLVTNAGGNFVAGLGQITASSIAYLWLTPSISGITAYTNTNPTVAATVSQTYLCGSSQVNLRGAGNGAVGKLVVTANGVQLNSTTETAAFGGGVGVTGVSNSGTMPTTVPATGAVLSHNAIGLHYDGQSASFNDYMIAPVQQGTANSQGQASRIYSGVARTTTNTAVTVLTIPIATSGTSAMFDANCIGRDVSAGTVGDTFAYNNTVAFKNVAGTVTAASTQGTARTAFDTSMSTSAVAYTVSGTNVLVQVSGLLSVNIDWTCEARALTN